MFDDKPANQNGIPANLPMGSGSPMMPPKPKVPDLPTEPEDILGDVDASDSAVKGPSMPLDDFMPSRSAAMMPGDKPVTKEPFFTNRKKIFATLVAIIVIGVLGAAGWYTYNLAVPSLFKAAVNQPEANSNVNQAANANEPLNANQGNQGAVTNQGVNSNQNVNAAADTDTDHDGLTDAEEALYGTNPNLVDTDHDGLTDRDEVKVFHTDPNNPDTDGDGYIDGDEVRAGYDPNSPDKGAKLLNVPQN